MWLTSAVSLAVLTLCGIVRSARCGTLYDVVTQNIGPGDPYNTDPRDPHNNLGSFNTPVTSTRSQRPSTIAGPQQGSSTQSINVVYGRRPTAYGGPSAGNVGGGADCGGQGVSGLDERSVADLDQFVRQTGGVAKYLQQHYDQGLNHDFNFPNVLLGVGQLLCSRRFDLINIILREICQALKNQGVVNLPSYCYGLEFGRESSGFSAPNVNTGYQHQIVNRGYGPNY